MDDLEKVQAQIAELLKKAEELTVQKKPAIIEDIRAKITAYGITARDLGFGHMSSKGEPKTSSMAGSTVAPKYQHQGKTWTGRGRQPKFIADYVASGGFLDDLKI